MRLGDEPESSNFEDRTGQSAGFGGGGGGGNMLGCLLPLVASRFGIVGVVVLLLGYCALTQLGGGAGGLLPSGPTATAPSTRSAGQSALDPNTRTLQVQKSLTSGCRNMLPTMAAQAMSFAASSSPTSSAIA